ncbi:MAG: toll/interleukin-1 receptor domain-containing protein, partial [Clostridia bacterium]|nr:toll/interleukin-1 receptor domain-containing protein [Clostridia bacterium]
MNDYFSEYNPYPYIYIQYCSDDVNEVLPVIDALNDDGFNVWYDDNFDVDDRYRSINVEKLNRSAALLLFYSKNAARSKLIRDTVKIAVPLRSLDKMCVCLDDKPFGMGFSDCKKNYTLFIDDPSHDIMDDLRPYLDVYRLPPELIENLRARYASMNAPDEIEELDDYVEPDELSELGEYEEEFEAWEDRIPPQVPDDLYSATDDDLYSATDTESVTGTEEDIAETDADTPPLPVTSDQPIHEEAQRFYEDYENETSKLRYPVAHREPSPDWYAFYPDQSTDTEADTSDVSREEEFPEEPFLFVEEPTDDLPAEPLETQTDDEREPLKKPAPDPLAPFRPIPLDTLFVFDTDSEDPKNDTDDEEPEVVILPVVFLSGEPEGPVLSFAEKETTDNVDAADDADEGDNDGDNGDESEDLYYAFSSVSEPTAYDPFNHFDFILLEEPPAPPAPEPPVVAESPAPIILDQTMQPIDDDALEEALTPEAPAMSDEEFVLNGNEPIAATLETMDPIVTSDESNGTIPEASDAIDNPPTPEPIPADVP